MNENKQKTFFLLKSLCDIGKLSADDFEWREEALLSALTTFRIGGKTSVLYPKNQRAAKVLYPALKNAGVKLFFLGNGSNVLAKDEGYDGIIFSLSKLNGFTVDRDEIEAEAGLGFTVLARIAQREALSGVEFAYGIPGSIGGAVFMNAGAYGAEISMVCKSVTAVFPDGSVRTLSNKECGFSYRKSVFQENEALILSVKLHLEFGDREAIRGQMADFMQRRRCKQPLEFPSAGSVFKRVEGHFTAALIDSLGMKGKRVGGAMVSEKHAGFIINYHHATAENVLDLIEDIQREVLCKTGFRIEPEIRVIE